MPNIFVANNGDREITGVESYLNPNGIMVYFTNGFVPFKDLDQLQNKLSKVMSSVKEDDYLILNGPNLLCVLLVFMWLNRFEKCCILHSEGHKGWRKIELRRREWITPFLMENAGT